MQLGDSYGITLKIGKNPDFFGREINQKKPYTQTTENSRGITQPTTREFLWLFYLSSHNNERAHTVGQEISQ